MYSLTIGMCYELKDYIANKRADMTKFHEMANNFFEYMMNNFEVELVVMGAKTALKTHGLPIEPSQIKCYEKFHQKYGKFIMAAS